MLISLAMLTEFGTVASRPELQRYLPEMVGSAFLRLLAATSVMVLPELTAPACRDPGDTALIATAVSGSADYLMTADPDLLDDTSVRAALAERGIRVVTTATFLSVLEQGKPTSSL